MKMSKSLFVYCHLVSMSKEIFCLFLLNSKWWIDYFWSNTFWKKKIFNLKILLEYFDNFFLLQNFDCSPIFFNKSFLIIKVFKIGKKFFFVKMVIGETLEFWILNFKFFVNENANFNCRVKIVYWKVLKRRSVCSWWVPINDLFSNRICLNWSSNIFIWCVWYIFW